MSFLYLSCSAIGWRVQQLLKSAFSHVMSDVSNIHSYCSRFQIAYINNVVSMNVVIEMKLYMISFFNRKLID